jgi:NADH:ubiquinone oxidoreductase subunit E
MKITVCIGSSCHIKGSRQVVETINRLMKEHDVKDKIELGGTFCLGKCQQSVCVSIDEEIFSVSPETAEDFFKKEVLTRL